MNATRRNTQQHEGGDRLSDLYDQALPEVYGYLRRRCSSTELAEDLTSSVFVTAALEVSRGGAPKVTIAWLMTVARNRLIDHWRHQTVADRGLVVLEGGRVDKVDPWEAVLDAKRAQAVLEELPGHYRGVLTLRYIDDLTVTQCAETMGRSVRSTESLLARARNTFRQHYEKTGGRHE